MAKDAFSPALQVTEEIVNTSAGYYTFDPKVRTLVINPSIDKVTEGYLRFNQPESVPAGPNLGEFDLHIKASPAGGGAPIMKSMPFGVASISLWVPMGGHAGQYQFAGCERCR